MDTRPQTTVLAIDPGASGGFSWKNPDGSICCRKRPETEGDILALLREIKGSGEMTVWLEEVGGYISNRPQSGSMMFNFGHGCGFLRGAVMALGCRLELVRPQKWQAPLGLGGKKSCASDAEWKRKLKAKSQQLFPDQPVTLATADALLILDYGLKNGQLTA